jgi:hypothetical protein
MLSPVKGTVLVLPNKLDCKVVMRTKLLLSQGKVSKLRKASYKRSLRTATVRIIISLMLSLITAVS